MIQLWRAFGDVVPLFIIIVLAMGFTTYFVIKKKNSNFKRVVVNNLFVISIIAILLITVFPLSYGVAMPRVVNFVPFIGMYDIIFNSVDITVPIRNLGLNILLFIPFGFLLSLRRTFNKRIVLNVAFIGLLLSFFIEIVQYIVPMGRAADIDDLILNTLGAYFGYVIWKFLNKKSSNIFTMKSEKTIERQ
ncbi:VanZ family protein [Gottfriedia acidiceleris]|uniref:VanZ family protein n=1 Tax=Gottfriedia acidiceleris TaxID=371036 RepID=UPI000B44A2B9|nr:VanZ family protein [Gottfriedia acidiceleris]